jgi:hypothetical protein
MNIINRISWWVLSRGLIQLETRDRISIGTSAR